MLAGRRKMRRRGSLAPRNAGAGRGWGRGVEGPRGTSTGCASREDGGQEMRGTSCGRRGQAGDGLRRVYASVITWGRARRGCGSRDAWEQAGAACHEGRQGGRNAAGEHRRGERKTLGSDCSPLPVSPSNPAPASRVSRKGRRDARGARSHPPLLLAPRPHSSLSPGVRRAQRMGGEGQRRFFF